MDLLASPEVGAFYEKLNREIDRLRKKLDQKLRDMMSTGEGDMNLLDAALREFTIDETIADGVINKYPPNSTGQMGPAAKSLLSHARGDTPVKSLPTSIPTTTATTTAEHLKQTDSNVTERVENLSKKKTDSGTRGMTGSCEAQLIGIVKNEILAEGDEDDGGEAEELESQKNNDGQQDQDNSTRQSVSPFISSSMVNSGETREIESLEFSDGQQHQDLEVRYDSKRQSASPVIPSSMMENTSTANKEHQQYRSMENTSIANQGHQQYRSQSPKRRSGRSRSSKKTEPSSRSLQDNKVEQDVTTAEVNPKKQDQLQQKQLQQSSKKTRKRQSSPKKKNGDRVQVKLQQSQNVASNRTDSPKRRNSEKRKDEDHQKPRQQLQQSVRKKLEEKEGDHRLQRRRQEKQQPVTDFVVTEDNQHQIVAEEQLKVRRPSYQEHSIIVLDEEPEPEEEEDENVVVFENNAENRDAVFEVIEIIDDYCESLDDAYDPDLTVPVISLEHLNDIDVPPPPEIPPVTTEGAPFELINLVTSRSEVDMEPADSAEYLDTNEEEKEIVVILEVTENGSDPKCEVAETQAVKTNVEEGIKKENDSPKEETAFEATAPKLNKKKGRGGPMPEQDVASHPKPAQSNEEKKPETEKKRPSPEQVLGSVRSTRKKKSTATDKDEEEKKSNEMERQYAASDNSSIMKRARSGSDPEKKENSYLSAVSEISAVRKNRNSGSHSSKSSSHSSGSGIDSDSKHASPGSSSAKTREMGSQTDTPIREKRRSSGSHNSKSASYSSGSGIDSQHASRGSYSARTREMGFQTVAPSTELKKEVLPVGTPRRDDEIEFTNSQVSEVAITDTHSLSLSKSSFLSAPVEKSDTNGSEGKKRYLVIGHKKAKNKESAIQTETSDNVDQFEGKHYPPVSELLIDGGGESDSTEDLDMDGASHHNQRLRRKRDRGEKPTLTVATKVQPEHSGLEKAPNKESTALSLYKGKPQHYKYAISPEVPRDGSFRESFGSPRNARQPSTTSSCRESSVLPRNARQPSTSSFRESLGSLMNERHPSTLGSNSSGEQNKQMALYRRENQMELKYRQNAFVASRPSGSAKDTSTNEPLTHFRPIAKRTVQSSSKNDSTASSDMSQLILLQQVQNKLITDPYGDTGHYSGVMVSGKPHGQGRMNYQDGRTYSGEWRRGRWHGHGHSTFANGDSYIGQYVNDQRHGRGRYEWSDGRVYDGSFDMDQRQGEGTYKWPDGAIYTGSFHKGLRHGKGRYIFADGSIYTGDWENGRYHGEGECVWADGRRYKGQWNSGQAQGYGVEHRPDGSIRHEGLWNQDRPVRHRTGATSEGR